VQVQGQGAGAGIWRSAHPAPAHCHLLLLPDPRIFRKPSLPLCHKLSATLPHPSGSLSNRKISIKNDSNFSISIHIAIGTTVV
jgi:hypothetical protein